MQFPIRLVCLVWIFVMFLMLASPSLAASRSSESFLICESTKQSPNNNAFPNFGKVMDNLSGQIKSKKYGEASITDEPPPVFGLAQCHKDLTRTDCEICYATARTKLPRCLPSEAGRIFLDGCFLRYSNYNFYEEFLDAHFDSTNCSSPTGALTDESLHPQFYTKMAEVITNVTDQAKENEGFAVVEGTGGIITVYALAQCWHTVSQEGCGQCLDKAAEKLKSCSPGSDGRAMFVGCYMRYSTDRFFTYGDQPNNKDNECKKLTTAIVIGVVSFAVLACFGAFIGYKRLSKKWREGQNCLPVAANLRSLNFKYEVLEKATKYFDNSRKLGQGGGGSVFMGTLPDGRNVAVKRLFFNTRQWVDQFFNEVNLISGIQHKNLVSLLGCSIEGPESLLVYEYVPNRSLDQILFVKNTMHILSWQQRFNIICGTAEGLAYLHGGCGSKIIHRDIKSGNILLDEKLTPKIADFGLARCVASDKSHVSTGIAGTLGYMAPEYLVRGQLTEKADVYAFGVVLIEIASGRKNSVFSDDSTSVLHSVWKHYKVNRINQSVDPSLGGKFPEKEASNVLQIGLLCTQASAALRPSMSEVVEMLHNSDYIIPTPKQPPFLNASVISPAESSKDSIFGLQNQKSFVTATVEVNDTLPLKDYEPS